MAASSASEPRSEEELAKLMAGLKTSIDEANELVQKQIAELNKPECQFTEAMSLIYLKDLTMANYNVNLVELMLHKIRGCQSDPDKIVTSLIRDRVVMEKIRPIEKKFRYRINKSIAVASGAIKADDPLMYRARPETMRPKLPPREADEEAAEGTSEIDGEKKKKKSAGKYVPPKLIPMFYDGEEEKRARAEERAKRKALSSSLIRDLQQQYSEGPEEFNEEPSSLRKSKEERQRRTEHEEDFLMRFTLPKAQKESKNRKPHSELDKLLDFGDYSAMDSSRIESLSKKRKPKFKTKKSKKLKGKKKHAKM